MLNTIWPTYERGESKSKFTDIHLFLLLVVFSAIVLSIFYYFPLVIPTVMTCIKIFFIVLIILAIGMGIFLKIDERLLWKKRFADLKIRTAELDKSSDSCNYKNLYHENRIEADIQKSIAKTIPKEKKIKVKYKIEFPKSEKNWTEELDRIKSYSELLEKECPQLYSAAFILVQTGAWPDKIVTIKYKLDEWLKLN